MLLESFIVWSRYDPVAIILEIDGRVSHTMGRLCDGVVGGDTVSSAGCCPCPVRRVTLSCTGYPSSPFLKSVHVGCGSPAVQDPSPVVMRRPSVPQVFGMLFLSLSLLWYVCMSLVLARKASFGTARRKARFIGGDCRSQATPPGIPREPGKS